LAGPSEAGAAVSAPGETTQQDETARAGSDAGPPPIDADTVAELAAIGCTRGEAAAWFGVPLAELRRRLREPALKDAWARGKARGRVHIRRSQFALAERNPTMASLLGRLMLGQDTTAGAAAPKKPARIVIDTGIDRGEKN